MPRRLPALLLVVGVLAVVPARALAAAATSLVTLRGRDRRGLDALLARQRDTSTADFRRWLTPGEFGRRFGARAHDVRRASRWLRAAGCRVRRLASRRTLLCVGARVPAVPAALRGAVAGVFGPEDAPLVVTHVRTGGFQPLSLHNGRFFLSPAEFARVYALDGAAAAGFDGRGQVIGIPAISSIDPADVGLFREFFGLPPADIGQQGGLRLPGTLAELEAVLDATWSGAIAPAARVEVDVGAMVVDSLARLVNRPDVSIITLSIDLCGKGPALRRLVREGYRLFRQAAAQGQTVLAASGNMGPTACGRRGTFPLSSSPFVTSVGGTSPSPVLDAQGNATAYGTEAVWNDGNAASGGGVSRLHRPRYQSGPRRSVPDVAFPADIIYPLGLGGHVGCCVGGTSAAAPTWAGAVALYNQMHGGRAGFLNPGLYDLGRAQRRGGVAVFHDVTEGANGIAGRRGFPARAGYDLATGWGTIVGNAFFGAFPGP